MTPQERGAGFRAIRNTLGMTLQQLGGGVLADDVRDKIRPVQRWEAGTTRPRQDILEAYVELLERLAILPEDAPFTMAELVFGLVDESTDTEAWQARLDLVFVPASSLRKLAANASMTRNPDGSVSLHHYGNPHHRISPTLQRIVFRGPDNQRLRIRVERDGSIDAQLPMGWVLEQIGATKIPEEQEAPAHAPAPPKGPFVVRFPNGPASFPTREMAVSFLEAMGLNLEIEEIEA